MSDPEPKCYFGGPRCDIVTIGNTLKMATTTNASTTSVKLDPETKERIRQLASARRRSPHWLMREAIEEYVEREEKREQFRRDAETSWAHYRTTGLHVTREEADAWLSKLEAGKKTAPPKCHD